MNLLLAGQASERLEYRGIEPDDALEWKKLFEHGEAARYLAMGHLTTPEEQTALWFERSFQRIAAGRGGLNALIERGTGKLVGMSGLLVQEVDGEDMLEVGYSILPEFRKLGYATEAAGKCRDYAFEHNLTDALISIIHVENKQSIAVAKRKGMSLFRKTEFKGMPVDIYRMGRKEWQVLLSTTK